jgi:hypothetical protein
MFAASLGLVKTSIEAVMKEDGEFGITMVTSSKFGASCVQTRRDFGCGRLGSGRNVIRSIEEGPGPVQERKEPIEVHFQFYWDPESHIEYGKLMKRIEDLLKESSALKAHLVSNLQDLNNSFSELIYFGISLTQQIMPYLNDVRGSRRPFQFEHVLSLVRRTASSTVNKGSNALSPWQGVSDYIANVLQQAKALVPVTMESGNTLKSTCS